jgi:hypothetical protein
MMLMNARATSWIIILLCLLKHPKNARAFSFVGERPDKIRGIYMWLQRNLVIETNLAMLGRFRKKWLERA